MTVDELKAARATLGLTQNKMADVMRTGLRQYQKWENGEAPIRPIVALTAELLITVAGTEAGKKFGV
ncbi:DNA-binding transcriptional regulator [Endozoicomonas sp. SCSIO W0465]|uniref:helix-turn-helix domain-containing protein n=1 Tax=Endozoicomonas sp. SCSIO W0465 TaxID=2918516 RepID=UPI002075C158|nr:helix-turn-helix domain-containing protein [Endozoicomonas sp. SCSIO W0465]USE39114.1 helix-turn-helix transcriptional regulator [Endozoicomonas sp. SCSIO W0465]